MLDATYFNDQKVRQTRQDSLQTYNWVQKVVIRLAFSDKVLRKYSTKLFRHSHQLFDVNLWSCVYNRCERLIHIFRRPVTNRTDLVKNLVIKATYPNFSICVSLPLT